MTISTTQTVATFLGNGVTTVFTFSFVGDQKNDLQLYSLDNKGNATLLSPSTYTLTLNTVPVGGLWGIGGTVTYPNVGSPIASGTSLVLSRVLPLTQTTSIGNQGAFYPTAVEQALDTLEMQIQQLATDVNYSFSAPITDPTPPTPLPSYLSRANSYFAFDSQGNPQAIPFTGSSSIITTGNAISQPTTAALLSAYANTVTIINGTVAVTAGRTTQGDNGGGTFYYNASDLTTADNGGTIRVDGAGRRWYLQPFRGPMPIEVFGGGPSVSDNSTAMTNALTWLNSQSGGALLFGFGTYTFTAAPVGLSKSNNIELTGQGQQNAGVRASMLSYTGTGSGIFLDARSSNGFKISHLTVQHTSASFTGDLVSITHTVSAPSDSEFFQADSCLFSGQQTANAINMDGAILNKIRNCQFTGWHSSIQGSKSLGVGYCINTLIQACSFNSNVVAPIQGGGTGWSVDTCSFEPLTNSQAGAVDTSGGGSQASFSFTSNWCGDVSVGGGTWAIIDSSNVFASNNSMYGDAGLTTNAFSVAGGSNGTVKLTANFFFQMRYPVTTPSETFLISISDNVIQSSNGALFDPGNVANVDRILNYGRNAVQTGAAAGSPAQKFGYQSTAISMDISDSGLIHVFGQSQVTVGTPLAVNYLVAFPNNIFNATASCYNPTTKSNVASVASATLSTITLNVAGSAETDTVMWHVWGN